jgi:peptidoglycan/LPS O-acetylase OafA/YrhL
MYVWHLPIVRLAGPLALAAVKPLGFTYPIPYTIVIIMLSFGAAWISYHLFEKHFLRLKRYFVPRLRK